MREIDLSSVGQGDGALPARAEPSSGGSEANPAHVMALVDQTDEVLGSPTLSADANQAPVEPPREHASRRLSKTHQSTPGARRSIVRNSLDEAETFFQVFGYFGLPMVSAFVFSAVWTFTLAFIQVYPNEMANGIMNTTDFDDGQFWLLPQPDSAMVAVAVVLLVLFGIGYLYLAFYMVFYFRKVDDVSVNVPYAGFRAKVKDSDKQSKIASPIGVKLARLTKWVHHRVVNVTPIQRHYFNAGLDVPKLIFQTMTLFTYLELGFPTPLIYFFSVLLLANWLVSSYRYKRYLVDPKLVIARLFYMFDLFFAVFSTLVVLVYFIYDFRFDRASFEVKQMTMTPMNYDRVARLFGDPAQISSFSSAFHYLQLTTGSSIFFKSSLNLLSLYKWRKIILTLILNFQSDRPTVQPSYYQVDHTDDKMEKASVTAAQPRHQQQQTSTLNHCAWPMRIAGALFFVAGSAIFVYSMVAVDSTTRLCSRYSRCGIYSYQWNIGSSHCSCLMFVDRFEAPPTFAVWNEPEDTTANLEELAVAGKLRIIQIINRAVPELPASLRNCVNLERVIMIYTKTEHLPDWMADLTHMEYLHIEDDLTPRRLQAIPDGLFDRWSHMTFLHFGSIVGVKKIPSLSNLHHLQYLTLVGLESMTEFPSLNSLGHLRTLLIADATHIPTLPSLARLKRIKSIALRFRNAVCCNGYLTGRCDLTAFACRPRANEALVACTDARVSEEDTAILKSVDAFYCPTDGSDDVDLMMIAPTEYTTDTLCGGVLYKQCNLHGVAGICYNSRMQVINCVILPEYTEMRRLQIQRGVGSPCDPTIEAWLGCV